MIKAAFIGAHSTGKTTLLKELSDLYMGVPLITEIARGFGTIPERRTPAFTKWQWDILEEQIAHERIYGSTGFLSDRSTLDNLAYYAMGNTDSEYVRGMYWSKALNNLDNYTHLFYLPVEFPIDDDGYRDVAPEYQFNIDIFIQKMIAQKRLDVVRVTGCIEERVAIVNNSLQRWIEDGN